MNTGYSIMYIDDEEPNLIAFKAIFRREFNIILAQDTKEALDLLNENPDIKVIISDNRMHGRSGIEFFESILNIHPDPVRIILTGFADQNAMMDSINRARVFRFLSKPWNEYDLRQTINSAVEIYETRLELRKKQDILENNLSEVNKFILSASNEMRSTLVSMHGIVRLLMNGQSELTPEQFLPLLDKGILQIDIQLRNIIDHYNNGRSLSKNELVDIEKSVDMAVKHFDSLSDRDIFNLRFRKEGFCEVYTDSFKIQLIFFNLITFIVNHKPEGSDQIEIDVEVSTTEKGVEIIFTDNGREIDSDTSTSIFDLLKSGKGKNSIPLFLVKETIKELGGSIEIDSVPKAGTSYTIQLQNLVAT